MELFLLVFFLLRLLSFLYHLFNIIVYVIPQKSLRKTKIKSDFFFFFTEIIFQIGWLVFGNTIVLTPGFKEMCYKPDGSHFAAILMLVLVSIGYIIFILFIFQVVALINLQRVKAGTYHPSRFYQKLMRKTLVILSYSRQVLKQYNGKQKRLSFMQE